MKVEKIRLQKFMADNGIASRRKSEELIVAGRVKVNGVKAQIGDKVDPVHDKITFAGKPIIRNTEKVYIMLHKPRGFVTTMSDEQDRKCVAELVENVGTRVFPVGRLDRNSEGLLLMTNDGEFANYISSPKNHISKTYRVTVREKVTEEQLAKIEGGLMIDGRETLPCNASAIIKEDNRTVLQIILYEGKNREIRKMCEQVGLTVIRLKRIEIAGVKLGMLHVGKWRFLEPSELKALEK